MSQYLVVDYNNSKQKDPRIALRTGDQNQALREFKSLSANSKDTAVIIFDSEEDTCTQVSIQCEPIFLVNAVEYAREKTGKPYGNMVPQCVKDMSQKGVAKFVFAEIAKRLSGQPIPGIGDVVLGHIIAPYYAATGRGAEAAGAAAGMYGGLSGAIIGTVIGGPIGAIIGGFIGSAALGTGTTVLIRVATHPAQCYDCKGTGFTGNFYRCGNCNGLGHK